MHTMVGFGYNQGPYRDDYSAMWDWAPHDLSMMLDLLGTLPERVSAWGIAKTRPNTTLWDLSVIKLDFPQDVSGFVMNSWLMPQKCKKMTVVGDKKSIVYEDTLTQHKLALYEDSHVTYPEYEECRRSCGPLHKNRR